MAPQDFDRRTFLRTSASGLAAASLIGTSALGANDAIVAGFLGCGGRGRQLVSHVAARDDSRVAYVCDLDPRRLEAGARHAHKQAEARPKAVADFRTILDDKAVDVLFNATPDHWHCLPVIRACQAGKDAYVEKPLSHNIWEGRQCVRAARKYQRVVQVGTQNRSAPYCHQALERIRSGQLGDVYLCRVFNMKNRGPVKARPDAQPPPGVDYDLWLGPAPKRPFNPNYFHGRWHWFWDYSGGDIINDGVHQIDLARWLVGRASPASVVCTGGKFAFPDDAQQTPDTQNIHWEFDRLTLTFELTLWTPYMKKTPWDFRNTDDFPHWPFSATRIELYGTRGLMMMGRHGGGWQVFGPDGKVAAQAPGRRPTDRHIENLFACIRSRQRPNADVEEGHLSTVLCHLGNISYRVGGPRLAWDAEAERFPGDEEANRLVKRPGREPYRIPEEV
ncbi:MAG: Gfo/Idh/MocA family protein [Candidatus Brocadiia bacterium]